MKLTVFGSTGAVGKHVVAQALEEGHQVTAFARSTGKITGDHANLRVVQGDVLNAAQVGRAVRGQDAVICVLGKPIMNKENLRAAGTRNIIHAMENSGVRRLVCLSSFGVGESRGQLPLHYRLLLVPLLFRRVFADHGMQEELVRNSRLDWTLVRPGNFTDGAATGRYWHGVSAAKTRLKLKIARADAAQFILSQLGSDAYLFKAPGLSY